MCLLFSLSKYIIVPLLTEWLRGKDLIRYDSALTNCDERQCLYSIIECHRKPFQTSIFATFSFNQSLPLMLRFAKARGYNLADYKLLIGPQTLSTFKNDIAFNDRTLKTKFAYVKDIKSVQIEVGTSKEAQLVSRLLQCFPQIRFLKSTGCNIFSKVGQYCKHLTHLEVGRMGPHDSSSHLEDVFVHCKGLTHFSWTYYKNFNRVHSAIIVHGQSLQSIDLYAQLHKHEYRLTDKRYMMMLAVHGSNNRLTSVTMNIECKTLNALLWNRGAGLTQLDFHVEMYAPIDLDGVRGIGTACPNLTDVALPYGTSSAMCEVLNNLKMLKNFAGSDFCDESVAALACVNTLEILHFPFPWNLSFESLEFHWNNVLVLSTDLSEHSSSLLRHLPILRELTILPCYKGSDCITKWLGQLIPELTLIQVLEFQGTYWFSATLVQAIIDQCSSLTDLYCYSIANIKEFACCRFKIHAGRTPKQFANIMKVPCVILPLLI